MADENNGIGLTELLNQVKQELVAASTLATIKQSANGAIQPKDIPLFTYGNVELELQVMVKKDVKGGLKISVFEFGGGASRDDLQKIKVTLQPLFSREELLEILQEQNPKFLEYIKLYAPNALTVRKGSNNEILDDDIL